MGRVLRKHKPEARVVALEPNYVPAILGHGPGLPRIQGMGEGLVPAGVHLEQGERGEVAGQAAHLRVERHPVEERQVDGEAWALAPARQHLRVGGDQDPGGRHPPVLRRHLEALPGLAGMFSFSLALLDDHRNGLVLTSIYGRSDSRMYVKPVADGVSDVPLTDEEGQAIAQALGERGPRRG